MRTATNPATSKVTICARYARLSVQKRRRDGVVDEQGSIERQLADASEFIGKIGGALGPVYAEPEGTSGALHGKNKDGTPRRPAWDAMLADARAGKIGAVVMMSPDRGSRKIFEGGQAFLELYETGVKVYFLDWGSEPLKLDTPTEQQVFSMKLYGAAEFRHSIKWKTASAMRSLAAAGYSTGAKVYGYKAVPTGEGGRRRSRYDKVPAECAVVERIFAMSAEGQGDRRIACALAEDGAPSPGGGWSKQSVRRVLANDIYRGVMVRGRSRSKDVGGDVLRVRAPKDDWITVPAPDLRVVDDALWEKVQARRAKTRAHYLRSEDGRLLAKPESGLVARHLLNGILRCHECGGPMTYMGKANGTPRYYCSTHNAPIKRRDRGTCSNGRGVPVQALDRHVEAALYEKLVGDERNLLAPSKSPMWELCQERSAKLKRDRERATEKGERRKAEREVEKLEAQIGRLMRVVAAGGEYAERAIASRRVKVDEIKARLAEPVIELPDEEEFDRLLKETAEWLRWNGPVVGGNHTDPVIGRQALRRVGVERIVVKPDGDGWTFEGMMDLDRLLNRRSPGSGAAPP